MAEKQKETKEDKRIIRMEEVNKTYGGKNPTPALHDINLEIEKGEFVFIVGESGSGKTTLIRLLLKEVEPTSGRIVVNKKVLGKLSRRKVLTLRRDIGVVFQDFRLLEDRNVYENIAFAQKVIEAPNHRIRGKVLTMLSMVDLMDKYKSNPKELSGGEQQRVAIARALINEPPILIADEPTGNLDEANGWEIMRLLESANKRGTTIIVVTHNMEIVKAMRKRTIEISSGRIVRDSKTGQGKVEGIDEV